MKKGFTLVELLAVIVILGVLALLIVPNVAGTLKKQKENLYNVQISNIEEATNGWASKNFFQLPTQDGAFITIHLKDLVGLIDTDITNPKTDKKISQCLAIKITKVADTDNYTYEVDESTINNDNSCSNYIVLKDWTVPTSCTYYVGVTSTQKGNYTGATTTYTGGEVVTSEATTGDVFVCGDYEYRYNYRATDSTSWLANNQDGWGVRVIDNTKTTYGVPYSSINNKYIVNTDYMFYDCSNLTTLDVSNFDTSKVTSMKYMFYYCYELTTIDLSSFDTSKVTNMEGMFSGCWELSTLDVSSFNTSKVISMKYMFYDCGSLTTIDLSSFDTSKVTDMGGMFLDSNALMTLKVKSETEKTRLSSSTTGLNSSCNIVVVG